MRISKWIVPPGGWKYKQGEYTLISDTWDELLKIVKTHRVSNKLELGNVEKDVEDQLCELYPSFIINSKKK